MSTVLWSRELVSTALNASITVDNLAVALLSAVRVVKAGPYQA